MGFLSYIRNRFQENDDIKNYIDKKVVSTKGIISLESFVRNKAESTVIISSDATNETEECEDEVVRIGI